MTPPSTGTMSLVDMGIGVASSAVAGVGQYEAGQAEKKAYDYNADVQAAAIAQKFGAQVGRQASTYAAAGVDIASGSPLLIMAATAARGAKEVTENTNMLRYEGKMAAWKGTMAGIGTFLSGLTKSMSGYYGANAPTPSPTANPDPGSNDGGR